MSQTPPALPRFTFSDALRDCFEPVFANFATLAVLALLIVGLPYAVFAGIAGPPPVTTLGATPDTMRTLLFGLGQMANGTAQMFAAAFLQGTTAIVLVRQLSGGKATVREALRGVGKSALPLIAIALITVVAALVLLVLLVAVGAASFAVLRPVGATPIAVLVIVAFTLAGLVAGAVLLAGWTPSAPIAAVERIGPLAALARSWRLSRGSRWPILGVMVLIAILSGVVSAIAAAPASILLAMTTAATGGPGMMWPVIVILQAVGAAAGAMLYSAAPAAVYWNLRRAREGAAPADLAAVFD